MSIAERRDFEAHGSSYRPVIYTPREADWIETLPGEKLLFRVRSTEVGGSYAVLETIAAPNSGSPAHSMPKMKCSRC